MPLEILPLLVAAFSGVAMAVQGSINSALGKVVGLLESTFIVHLVGLLLVLLLLFVFRLGDGNLVEIQKAPWYSYFGGVLGVIIIYSVVLAIPKVGVAPATTAIILGQVFTAGLIDHFGLFGLKKITFNYYKVLGVLLMAGGSWLVLKK
ncbi:MAG: DMT family transporter [Peptococcaceae bacterium]|nr:DMT family transporter [Candidatus Syntrophopropionicum ammoniitolerans]